jgi:hypothetical protein
MLLAALLVLSLPVAAADAGKRHKRKFRGLVLTSVSKKGGSSVRPPTTFQANIGLQNPSRRRAKPQPLTVTLGNAASVSTFTPGIRRRSSTTFGVAITLPVGTTAAKYQLGACLGGKVFPGSSRCRTRKNSVNVLASRISLSINPNSKAFGDVMVGTTSPSQTFTIANTSMTQSNTPSTTISGVGYQLTSNGCTAPIAPGGSCTVAVAFSPATTGPSNGSLKVSANGETATATLTGNGIP